MKRKFKVIITLFTILMLQFFSLSLKDTIVFKALTPDAYTLKESDRYVKDYANMLTPKAKESIYAINSKFESEKLPIKTAVLCVNSLGQDDVSKVTKDLLNKWNLNNGDSYSMVIIYAKDDQKAEFMVSDNLRPYFSGKEFEYYHDVLYDFFSRANASEGIEYFPMKIYEEKIIPVSKGLEPQTDPKDESRGMDRFEYLKLKADIQKKAHIKNVIVIAVIATAFFLYVIHLIKNKK